MYDFEDKLILSVVFTLVIIFIIGILFVTETRHEQIQNKAHELFNRGKLNRFAIDGSLDSRGNIEILYSYQTPEGIEVYRGR